MADERLVDIGLSLGSGDIHLSDLIFVFDVSDTTDAGDGTSKKVTWGNLIGTNIQFNGAAGMASAGANDLTLNSASGDIVGVGDYVTDNNAVFADASHNPKTIASWTSGTAHGYLGVVEPTNDAYLHVQGAGGAYLAIVDTGGAANDKWAMWCTNGGRVDLHSYNDVGTSRASNIISCDMGTGNVGIGGTNTGTARLHVQGGRLQIDNNETVTFLNSTSGTGGTVICNASNDMLYTVDGTTMFTLDQTNTEFEFNQNAHFGTNTKTLSSNAVTIDFGESNIFELSLAAATGATTITLTEPAGSLMGSIRVLNHATTGQSNTWATTGSATIRWVDPGGFGAPDFQFTISPGDAVSIDVTYYKNKDEFVLSYGTIYTP